MQACPDCEEDEDEPKPILPLLTVPTGHYGPSAATRSESEARKTVDVFGHEFGVQDDGVNQERQHEGMGAEEQGSTEGGEKKICAIMASEKGEKDVKVRIGLYVYNTDALTRCNMFQKFQTILDHLAPF